MNALFLLALACFAELSPDDHLQHLGGIQHHSKVLRGFLHELLRKRRAKRKKKKKKKRKKIRLKDKVQKP
jgi:hypothetical protein